MRILIVEDEPAGRTLLTLMLEGEHEVLAVASVDEAERQLTTGTWQLLITDYKMPGKSGVDLIENQIIRGSAVPIILMTGQGSKDSGLKQVRNKVRKFLTKPFSRDDLMTAIAEVATIPAG